MTSQARRACLHSDLTESALSCQASFVSSCQVSATRSNTGQSTMLEAFASTSLMHPRNFSSPWAASSTPRLLIAPRSASNRPTMPVESDSSILCMSCTLSLDIPTNNAARTLSTTFATSFTLPIKACPSKTSRLARATFAQVAAISGTFNIKRTRKLPCCTCAATGPKHSRSTLPKAAKPFSSIRAQARRTNASIRSSRHHPPTNSSTTVCAEDVESWPKSAGNTLTRRLAWPTVFALRASNQIPNNRRWSLERCSSDAVVISAAGPLSYTSAFSPRRMCKAVLHPSSAPAFFMIDVRMDSDNDWGQEAKTARCSSATSQAADAVKPLSLSFRITMTPPSPFSTASASSDLLSAKSPAVFLMLFHSLILTLSCQKPMKSNFCTFTSAAAAATSSSASTRIGPALETAAASGPEATTPSAQPWPKATEEDSRPKAKSLRCPGQRPQRACGHRRAHGWRRPRRRRARQRRARGRRSLCPGRRLGFGRRLGTCPSPSAADQLPSTSLKSSNCQSLMSLTRMMPPSREPGRMHLRPQTVVASNGS